MVVQDFSSLLGTWQNTNGKTLNIHSVKFSLVEGALKMQVFGVCQPAFCDWGETDCQVFSDSISSSVITGISAAYDFGFKKTQIAGNMKQGVLVLQVYHSFQDDSGRINYFSREFYYRQDAN